MNGQDGRGSAGAPPSTAEAAASREVLLFDGNASVRQALEQVFREDGLVVTPVSDPASARDLLANRFFAVAVVDLDTPSALDGLDLVRFIKTESPVTATVVITPRKSFDAVAAAFRAGVTDVVPKTKDALPYLRERVKRAAEEARASTSRERLLEEVAELHDRFLEEMMILSRHATDLEDRILRGDEEGSTTAVPTILNLLLVDNDPELPEVLARELGPDRGWRLTRVFSSGEALDMVSRVQPQVLAAKEDLPDLPASMLVKSVRVAVPDLVALVYRPPRPAAPGASSGAPGEVNLVDGSQVTPVVPAFAELDQFLGALSDVREALRTKARDRRYLALFRKQHAGFLSRYNQIRQKLGPTPGNPHR